MSIEQKINQKLNKYPGIKKGIKRIYQRTMYTISPKIKSEGNIVRVSPDDPKHEYFFGYYDKCPEDATGRYVLCLKADDTWSDAAPAAAAEILLIDTSKPENDSERVKVIASTRTWNVQQGCMMQWLGPEFDHEIIYNDFRDGSFCSVILDVFNGAERVLAAPVYSVSADGSFALTLDFARLHRLRPGYGYSNILEETRNEKLPYAPAIWRLDINKNTVTPLLTYTDFASFEPRPEMKQAEHKVNHIMLSPSGKRFMVLHRWFDGQSKYTRLVTVNSDGSGMYNLSDDDMVSHCYWKDDETIIAFENKRRQGAGYYLMHDKTQRFERLWPEMTADGHPSCSPDGQLVVTDTYPNRARVAAVKVMKGTQVKLLAKVFAPFKYDNDTRCDLHPRWSRDGKKIYFDSVYEGHRGLYYTDVNVGITAFDEENGTNPVNTASEKIRIIYLMTSCVKLGPTSQTLNIIKNLDRTVFEPILITLYEEADESRLKDFLPCVSAHYLIKTGKKDIITGRDYALKNKLEQLKPDIIHTVGVFPDYAVSQIGKYRQVHTIRNYIYDDYPAKFGKVRGTILARMQLSAMKKSDAAIACSESLSRIYKEKLHMDLAYIRNGVDVDRYTAASVTEKKELREKLSLPADAFIFVYTGQFIERKNIPFLLENYVKQYGDDEHTYLLMLGGGPKLQPLQEEYKGYPRIDFRGNVDNVNEFLKACDAYVSTSKSEGLPNGVLEAMATGIPVVLSDIEQHKELFEVDSGIGYLYKQGDAANLIAKLKLIHGEIAAEAGKTAYDVAHKSFSAPKMSAQYQAVYRKISGK